MTSFTVYCTYMQLKTEQSMYSTNSSIQWLRFVFSSAGALYSSLKKRLEEVTHNSNCSAREFQANRTGSGRITKKELLRKMKALCSTDLSEREMPVEGYEDNGTESENGLDDNDNNMHEKQDAAETESTSEGRHDGNTKRCSPRKPGKQSRWQPKWMWEVWQACCARRHMRPM